MNSNPDCLLVQMHQAIFRNFVGNFMLKFKYYHENSEINDNGCLLFV